MARYPGAIWKPINPGYLPGRRLVAHNRMNFHVAAGITSSLWGFFNAPERASSHFYVRFDGTVEQYVDTDWMAEADYEGNDATVSVETEGLGPGTWTNAQKESLARLFAWVVKTHGVANKLAFDSKIGTSSKGLSWHRLGIDGNFPNLPDIRAGRIQRGGGMRYSKSLGKECPGSDRVRQMPEIWNMAQKYINGAEPAPAPAPNVKEWDQLATKEEIEALIDAAHPVEIVFFSNNGTMYEANVPAGTYRPFASPTVFSGRKMVLTRLGVRWTAWKNAAGTTEVEQPEVFGTEVEA